MKQLEYYCKCVFCYILVSFPWQQVSGRSLDEIIAGASETSSSFNLADMDAGTMKMELDMILTLQQYSALYLQDSSSILSADRRPETGRQKRKAIKGTTYRWPNNEVPYRIVSNVFSSNDLEQIDLAINEWQNYTCIVFRKATNADQDYVSFDNGNGCYSYVGKVRGPQVLGLASGCRVKGVIAHEMGHAIGFHHEQNRPDRDDFIKIREENIPASLLHNFKKYPYEAVETYGVPYDYRSVMHYGGRAFSINGQLTIETKDTQYQNVIGNRDGLSFFDIKLANLMYGCGNKCSKVSCPEIGFVDKNCRCWCPGRPVQPCGNSSAVQTTPRPITNSTAATVLCRDMNRYCKPWSEAGYCKTNEYVMTYCKESCNTCKVISGQTSSECKDINTSCQTFMKRGYCRGFYINYMRTNCKKTCDFCKSSSETVQESNSSSLVPSVSCKTSNEIVQESNSSSFFPSVIIFFTMLLIYLL